MSTHLLPIAAAIAVSLPSGALAHMDGPSSEIREMPGIIHVTATATVDTVPDTVSISAGIQSNAPTAQEAMAMNSEQMRGVFAALEQNGVDKRDISTSYINLNPRYDYERRVEGQPRLTGYQASNQITVKTRNLDRTGPLIDSMIRAGVNTINGVNFQVSNPEVAQDSARMEAIEKAKVKARMMAQAAGVELGRLLSIKEGSSPGPIAYNEVVVSASRSIDAAPPTAPGQREIGATVTLSYAIAD